MLLWAKKGQNAEWKLTSIFFHPNCCNPRIISSVNKPKLSLLVAMSHSKNLIKELSHHQFLWQIDITFHDFMIFHCIFGVGCILCSFLRFGCFRTKMGTIGGNWGTILNINNMLVTIQRSARGLPIKWEMSGWCINIRADSWFRVYISTISITKKKKSVTAFSSMGNTLAKNISKLLVSNK